MSQTVDKARMLRKNQTEAEKKLWSRLRARQLDNLKFRRQHAFSPYIIDFFCEKLNLAIELDGGQHNPLADQKRDDFLQNRGIKILRFWNNEIFDNLDGVLQKISTYCQTLDTPSPKPSPRGEGLSEKRICLGKITGAHGLKGLAKIFPYGEDVQLFQDLSPLYTAETGDKTLCLSLKHRQGKHMLAEIDGITDRDGIDAIKGTELWVARDALPATDEGEYYIEDLKNLIAVDENGDKLGIIAGIHNFGAGDLLEIKFDAGGEALIPFENEYVGNVADTVELKNIEKWLD